jgi:methyltransferase-like protein/SAM-dependent methyltransferase
MATDGSRRLTLSYPCQSRGKGTARAQRDWQREYGMSSTELTSYDVFPYPNYSFPQTHPDRLAVIATLLGLTPPPVERCRVLELGCAAGSNLIPMAEELPHSTFVGIDLSGRQIAEGQRAIAEFGLANIDLRHQSILDFEPGSESFDYILCHGVYSWVPTAVQDRILAICARSLRPDGVAYVSYNTLPGWHLRGMIRDMMLYHGRWFSDPRQQVAEARGLLDFLVSQVTAEQNPYGQFLRAELDYLRRESDSYLFHEHLEEHNSPIFFHQFVERAAGHGLRYLADADLHTLEFTNFPPPVAPILERVSADWIQQVQYLDFLQNRTFRQSSLCHARCTPVYRLEPGALMPLFIASPLRPSSSRPDLNPTVREDFRTPSGSTAFSIHPIIKAALVVLGEAWPQVLPFQELCLLARAKLDDAAIRNAATVREDEQQVEQALVQFYTIAGDLMEFRLRPLSMTKQPGPQPRARALACWQARSSRWLTNVRHEYVAVDEFGQQAIQRLDGRHTRPAVVQELAALFESGQLIVQQHGEHVAEPERVRQLIVEALEERLAQFAGQALLLA